MSSKKFTALFLSFVLLLLVTACSFFQGNVSNIRVGGVSAPLEPGASSGVSGETFTHPLTGLQVENENILGARPAAVMVSNIAIARPIQAGVGAADVVFETVVEGGITRYLAVFQDIENMPTVGSVRSSRHAHFQLAAGLDAIFVHHGSDRVYTQPAMQAINFDNQNVGVNQGAFRHRNGMSSEHTLYTSGELLHTHLTSRGVRLQRENPRNLFNFSDGPLTLGNAHGSEVGVRFSGAANTSFAFNPETRLYTRSQGGTRDSDFFTNDLVEVTNIFVLFDDIAPFPNGVHMQAALQGGRGYYITNGTFVPIRWEKGGAREPLRFLNESGSPLLVNPGRSWVSLMPNSVNNPVNFNIPVPTE